VTSSIYTVPVTPVGSIASGNNLFTFDITITSQMVSPGGAAILRLFFAFTFNTDPGTIQVFNNGNFKGNFINPDNSVGIIDDGMYKFDVDVVAGDNINLQLLIGTGGNDVTATNFIRAQLIQFGA